ncbi:MAG: hypothetical protein NC201_06455 [Prevotella sp.]|nr:hypothetical protein [Bacteroides sp.]MCM1366870.1 hypothetical protein [Prevotella sp.]
MKFNFKKKTKGHAYVWLWLLLSLALILILLFALAKFDISIGGWTMKKAPFAETLFNAADTTDTASLATQQAEAEAASKVIKTDSTPQRIFIFGDSMTMHLAQRLAAYGKQNGHTVYAVNWDSSNTKTWAGCDTIQHFIKEYNPTIVFIALGANELYLQKPEIRLPEIKAIIQKIGNVPYIWIGPPSLKVDGGLNDVLEKNLAPKSFFRSSGLELARKRDHIHPTRDASAQWIDSVMKWLPNSCHPFVAEFPADSVSKAAPNLVFLKAKNK